MPSVPGRVVRRRGHSAIRQAVPPVRLTFQVRPVTAGALFVVNDLAACDELRVIRLGGGGIGARGAEPHRCTDREQENDAEDPPYLRGHRVLSDRRYLMSAVAARTRTPMSRSHSSPAPHIMPPTSCIMRSIIGQRLSDGLVHPVTQAVGQFLFRDIGRYYSHELPLGIDEIIEAAVVHDVIAAAARLDLDTVFIHEGGNLFLSAGQRDDV